MCGIIGYFGNRDVVPVLLNSLKKLEYRGYDSSGICVLNNKSLTSLKKKGRISVLESDPVLCKIFGHIGIAHTRWATHGIPNEINAHPHLFGNIAIVHNGIIENFVALKKLLIEEGHKFVSDTDSEVLAHLISKFYNGDLESAVTDALKLVEGTFGLAVLCASEEKIVVARRGSPLIIGVGDDEMFVASDIPAILNYTKKVIYLEDNELAIIDKSGYSVKHLDGSIVNSVIHQIKWSVDQIEKKGFKHFMLKEIFEQPESIENLLRGRLTNGKIKLSVDFDIRKVKRIIIVACGTSWHSALIGKYLIESFTDLSVQVDYASEFRYRRLKLDKESDLFIVISQSGETADTLAALQKANPQVLSSFGIVNVVGSTISREVSGGFYLHAGPEIGVASTKAFTSQVLALLLLALYLRQEKNSVLNSNILQELKSISQKVRLVLKSNDEVLKIASVFKDKPNFIFLGRGINFPVALEGALKLKEISYIHAEGYPAAEMKHGPIALVDENMPVVFIATKDLLLSKVMSNMQEVKARGGKIIAIVNDISAEFEKLADYLIVVHETTWELSPIINSIPLQLLAYHIADLRKLDVDKPRNLAKSVTVE